MIEKLIPSGFAIALILMLAVVYWATKSDLSCPNARLTIERIEACYADPDCAVDQEGQREERVARELLSKWCN